MKTIINLALCAAALCFCSCASTKDCGSSCSHDKKECCGKCGKGEAAAKCCGKCGGKKS